MTEAYKRQQLDKFVTKVWQHPLLTDATVSARREAFGKVQDYMAGTRDMLVVPVGDVIWASSKPSDVKFEIIFNPPVSDPTIDPTKPLLHDADMKLLAAPFTYETDVDSLAMLYLTPDDYIAGDHAYLHDLRLRAIDPRSYVDAPDPHAFPKAFQTRLRSGLEEIKKWTSRNFGGEYVQLVTARGAKSHYPIEYPSQFRRRVTYLSPPRFDTVQTEIHASGGAIQLRDRYRAMNLTSR